MQAPAHPHDAAHPTSGETPGSSRDEGGPQSTGVCWLRVERRKARAGASTSAGAAAIWRQSTGICRLRGGAAAVRGSCASPGCAIHGSNRRAQAIHGLLAPDPRTTASFATLRLRFRRTRVPAMNRYRCCGCGPAKPGDRFGEGRRCKGISSERYMDVPRPRVGAGRGTTRRTKSPCRDGPRRSRGFTPTLQRRSPREANGLRHFSSWPDPVSPGLEKNFFEG